MGRLDDIIARNRQHLAPHEKRKLDQELNLSAEAAGRTATPGRRG